MRFPMFIINESIPLVLKLNPNPNSIKIDRQKVYSQTQTLGGWVFEHWGEKPRTMHVRGRTQPVLDNSKEGHNTDIGVEAALFALQQVYNLDKRGTAGYLPLLKKIATKAKILGGSISSRELKALSSTFIYYKFDLYNGFFTDFSYQQDAEQMPRHYEYEFQFVVTSTAQSVLTDSLFTTSLGSLAGLAHIGASGNIGQGVGLLAGSKIIRRIGGLR